MTPFALVLLVALAQGQEPKAKPVPKDSVEVLTRGCLKGRVFTATPRPADEGCGKELDHWFTEAILHPKPSPAPPKPRPGPRMADLPDACRRVLLAP